MECVSVLGSNVQKTWIASLVTQVVALALSITAVASDDVPSPFRFVLILELVVSSIQLCWYTAFYALFFIQDNGWALDIKWRYLDWVLTTPTMLLTLNTLIKAWYDDCASMSDIATPGWIIGNLVAIGFNTLMLHGGFRVESGRVENERETLVLVASCLPFVFAFLPSTIFVAESYSVEGFLVLLFTFLVWALYAVNALANRNDVEGKASIYNLLDIFSKNVFAFAIAIQVLVMDERSCI